MNHIPVCKFEPMKYGAPSDADIVDIESFRDYIWTYPTYRTNYYSIYLVTCGEELLEVEGVVNKVTPGVVICSRLGELWHWEEESKLDGEYLYWTDVFLNSFFNDPQFINRFSFFQVNRNTSFLYPNAKVFRRLLALFNQMKEEIEIAFKPDCGRPMSGNVENQHMLRALVYETLMLLERVRAVDSADAKSSSGSMYYINEFQRLALEHYRREHKVDYYAGRLFITSNYLNKIIQSALGVSTKQYLLRLLIDESKRLLKFTRLTIDEIASELNLDMAYFIKVFRLREGITPLQYRKLEKRL